jgi:hypothetical protein
MLEAGRSHRTLAARLAGHRLCILYEFTDPAAPRTAAEPYVLRIEGERRTVEPGPVPFEQADIVIRTTPTALHRITNGDLGSREAMAGGLLDIRKAPSMPKLLLMRSLFNTYKKSRRRDARNEQDQGDRCGVQSVVDRTTEAGGA